MAKDKGSTGKGGVKGEAVHRASPVDVLTRFQITIGKDGGFHVPPEALQRIRENRIREDTIGHVPNVPRHLWRTGGGVGVDKQQFRVDSMSLRSLRELRERIPVVQAIHRARDTQVLRLSRKWNGKRGDIGWRIAHKDHLEQHAVPPESIRPLIKRAEGMLENPSPRYCKTTGALFRKLEEELLTINRPTIELLPSLYDESRTVAFRPVDGAIIWPTLYFLQNWISENPQVIGVFSQGALRGEDALEVISEYLRFDLVTAEYCLVREGTLEAVYEPGRILVNPIENRTDIRYAGYWPSHVEQAAEMVLAFWNTWTYNAAYFTRGMLAEFILGISGNVSDQDIDAFVDLLRQATQGANRAWQPPIMPLPEGQTIQKIDLKSPNKDMMYETWMSLLIALSTAVYRMDPSTINAKPWDGGSGPQLSAPNREKEIALAKEEGLQSDMQHLIEGSIDPIIRQIHPDLRVLMEYGDFDPEKEARVMEIRIKTTITRNEARMSDGLDPIGFWLSPEDYKLASDEDKKRHDKNLWNMPADPAFVTAFNQQSMQDLYGAGAAQPAPTDDGFGEPVPGAPQPPPHPGMPPGAPAPRMSGAAPGSAGKPPPAPPPPSGVGGVAGGHGGAPLMKGRRVRVGGSITMLIEPLEGGDPSAIPAIRLP